MNIQCSRMAIVLIGLMLFLSASVLAQTATPPAAQQQAPAAPSNDTDLPRFLRVNESLALGGQPTTSGIRKLSEMGFKTIVNLVSLKEGSMLEAKTVEFYSMKFLNVEFTAENLNDALVSEFIQTVENKENQPLYIHCKTGNRIAALWMIYRVRKEGWKFETALQEANRLGLTDSPIRDAAFKYLGKPST